MKIFLYSHDTFGLGHLRRARTIANYIAAENESAEILIVSGSPVSTAFTYPPRVKVIQIPPVRKLSDGSYTPLEKDITIAQVVRLRSSALLHHYLEFEPDLIIVDKEPLGLHSEMLDTLSEHKNRGLKTVLGLREVLDAPEYVKAEWERKHILDHLDALYQEIWVYGPASFYNPLTGIELSPILRSQVYYTGFLQREIIASDVKSKDHYEKDSYVLVTSGGGGDGIELMLSVIEVAKTETGKGFQFLLVVGPFMPAENKAMVEQACKDLTNIKILDFHADHETLLFNAKLVIGMCGYNTFCEVISFNKRAIFVPRVKPRREQSIRAARASELDWCTMLDAKDANETEIFINTITRALKKHLPMEAIVKPDLGGLDKINRRIRVLTEKN